MQALVVFLAFIAGFVLIHTVGSYLPFIIFSPGFVDFNCGSGDRAASEKFANNGRRPWC